MLQTKSIPLEIVELKAEGDGTRTFSAYASTFGNEDHGGDVVVKGAFARTLKARAFRPLLWQHDQRTPIGIEKSLREDSKGLLGTWQLLNGGPADYAYECLKTGAVRAMSIGYLPDEFDFTDNGETRRLKAVDLLENSVVSLPMNESAVVTGVKYRFCPECGTELEGKAEWDTAYINNLPDSAFAAIESGGDKDADGKTVPRSLRHYPHHNAAGALDLPHLRAALSRVADPNNYQGGKGHLQSHANSEGVGKTDDDHEHEHEHHSLELDLDVPFEDLLAQVKGHLTIGVDEAEALHARRRSEQRELSEAHVAALRAFADSLKGTIPRVDELLRAPAPATPEARAGGEGMQLRLELARRRLRMAGIEV